MTADQPPSESPLPDEQGPAPPPPPPPSVQRSAPPPPDPPQRSERDGDRAVATGMVVGGGVLIVFTLLLEMGRELTEDPLTLGYIVVQGFIVISAGYLFIAGLGTLDRASKQ